MNEKNKNDSAVTERSAMKAFENPRGFTLVEIIVSVAILMLLILGVGAMLTTSIQTTTYNEDRHMADGLAQGLMEKITDYAAQGVVSYGNLERNNTSDAMPKQEAIPGLRPEIPAGEATDRIYDDFDGDGVADRGLGSKNIYVYQMLIDDIAIGGQTGFLKEITVRIYYADQNSLTPAPDPAKHPDPGGAIPRRFGRPLSEMSTYVATP